LVSLPHRFVAEPLKALHILAKHVQHYAKIHHLFIIKAIVTASHFAK
jgi:hypothetical protein